MAIIGKKTRAATKGFFHEEGKGESEKDLPGLSQDGISTVHTDDQGNINVTEEGNKTEVSGSTTEKAKTSVGLAVNGRKRDYRGKRQ